MRAVYKKDLRNYFNNVIGWLFIGVLMFFYGLYFFAYNISAGQPTISYTIGSMPFLLVIAIPILTMRSFAEERKNRTDQLLLTSPVSVPSLVLGKFLAAVTVLGIVSGMIALSPLFLRIFGKVLFRESYVALLGFFLYGIACIAIGILMSSLTESQMIAAILSIAVLFIGYMMTAFTGLFPTENAVTKLLNCYDLNGPFKNFQSGIIDLKSVVYFLSIAFLCLFLTCEGILKRRWTVSVKKIRTGAFSLSLIAVALVCVIASNVAIGLVPERFRSYDATTQKYYSLTKETKKYLSDLKADDVLYILSAKSDADDNLKKTAAALSDYKAVTVRYIDPDEDPTFASQYTDTQLSAGSLIVVNQDTGKSKAVDAYDLYQYDYNYSTFQQSVSGYDGEGQILSAIQYVNADTSDLVCFVTGHSETELGSSFSAYLDKRNMTSESLNLLTDDIPSDCSLLILNGALTDLSEEEAAKLENYISSGGKTLIALNPDTVLRDEGTPNLKGLLADFGIQVENDLVRDDDARHHASQNLYFLYPDVSGDTDLTEGITDTPGVLVPYPVSFTAGNNDMSHTDFLTTSDNAGTVSGSAAAAGDDSATENKGTFVLGTAVAADGSDTPNLIVTASCYMFLDDMEKVAPGKNTRFFSNILTMAAGTADTDSIVIPVKSYSASTIQFSAFGVVLYGMIWGLLVPLALILIGIVRWLLRRRK